MQMSYTTDVELNRKFGSHATMAYDQATFEGVLDQITVLWTNMNDTWPDVNSWNTTYNSWWGAHQAYDNSLAAQNDYFARLSDRLRMNLFEQDQILNHNKSIMTTYTQWYQQALNDTRREMKGTEGLLWVIKSAYYFKAGFWVYWAPVLYGLIFAVLAISACTCFVIAYEN